jgi:putative tricarboxylic transport membrane protein
LQEAGEASAVSYENKGGAAGAIGTVQFFNASKGHGNAMMVMGPLMLGGIITGRPTVSVTQLTPLARLTSEYNVFVLPAHSPFKAMADVVAPLKKDPGSVKWGGGSRGSTEHIAAAILGGNVTIGGSGYSEFQQYIEAGKMKPIGVTSQTRLKGIAVPTLKEQGIDVVIGNWRGVHGAAGISDEQCKALVSVIVKATKTKTKAWAEALDRINWTPALLTGKEFEDFVDRDVAYLRAKMVRAGMI